MSDSYPKRIGDLLGGAARKWGMAELVDAGRIGEVWRAIVGEDIAAHVVPTSLRDGVLRVRAESAIWATEVGYLTDDIGARVNAALGRAVVNEVRIWTAPGSIAQPTSSGAGGADRAVRLAASQPAEQDPKAAFEKARAAWIRRRNLARSQGPRTGESRR